MSGATLGHAQSIAASPAATNAVTAPAAKSATAPVAKGWDAPTPAVTGYRFATVIRSQATREQLYNNAASITNAQIVTQLSYSPMFAGLKECQEASAKVSQLLGAQVSIRVGSSSALETFKNSECMPSNGP